ncbi:hypothetical protein N4G70_29265 [Streptomyces sp. ASQP_92]|uniref:hypothetical protein n=1 Tax=Streptomyces sp. ASQP_92 TaxID=2979116 RepID=UPI0021C06960|nr:hypothetical protein [Streptomyces sp. ASQP_92]MCT9092931.1 hypothetical protein [Streptomyces sp. ASQP_92]
MSEYTLLQETQSDRLFIRTWAPGDGVTCSFARMQRGTPCTPPVAVTITEDKREHFGKYSRTKTKRIVCRNHLPGLSRPSEINTEARKAATERLIVGHWDEYQSYLAQETASRREAEFDFADPEIRKLVLDARDPAVSEAGDPR